MGQNNANLPDFFAEAQDILDALGSQLTQVEGAQRAGEVNPDLINTLFRHAHSLKGICAMFGFVDMAAMAHALEGVLDGMRLGRVAPEPAAFDTLFACVDRFGQDLKILAAGEPPASPTDDALIARLAALARRVSAQQAPPSSPHRPGHQRQTGHGDRPPAPPVPPPPQASQVCLAPQALTSLSAYETHRLQQTVDRHRTLIWVSAAWTLESLDSDLSSIEQMLRGHTEVIAKLPAAGGPDRKKIYFDLLVGSDLPAPTLEQALGERVLSACCIDVSVIGRAAPLLEAAVSAPTFVSASDLAGAPILEAADPSSRAMVPSDMTAIAYPADAEHAAAPFELAHAVNPLAQTVRVDIRRLDKLMNLVGELSMSRQAIDKLSDALKQEVGYRTLALEMHKESRSFDRRLAELQAAILQVRMVPLTTLFERLVRSCRAIAQELGRQVRVVVQGQHTELDKLIVEDLSAPLMHLVRNAIDHGIEAPTVREAHRKPPEGVVQLTAATQGNHVVVEVGDDGAGIDVERTRSVAVERGLLHANDAQKLSQREVFNLLFVPGLSTRQTVTAYSGRGVGLDVVKTNISKLSGVVDIWSETGLGSRFTVTLPMTLAIIPALIVRVSTCLYAIPLNMVMETLDMADAPVHTIEGRHVIAVRGHTVPVLDLVAVFNLGAAPRQAQSFGVLAGVGHRRITIQVDELLGQQDIVIKSLGRRLANVFGVAGATNLGNKQTILVLDVPSLMTFFEHSHAHAQAAPYRYNDENKHPHPTEVL